MKITPKIAIKITNREEKLIALNLLSKLTGISINSISMKQTIENKNIMGFPYVYAKKDLDRVTGNCNARNFDKIYSLNEFINKYYGKDEETVKLNDSYNAIVNKDNITVGCQKFPLEVAKQLYNAVKKIKSV